MIKAIIVDDDKSCINELEKLLTKYCPHVLVLGTANTIAEAIDLMERKKPQLLFLDVDLNGQLGFDLLKHPEANGVNVIFTISGETNALNAVTSAGFEYLQKPVDHNDLKAVFDRLEKQLPLTDHHKRIETLLSHLK